LRGASQTRMYTTAEQEKTQLDQHEPRDTLTLAALAHRKRIPIAFLRQLGCADASSHIEIPYFLPDGSRARTRCRNASGVWWDMRTRFAYTTISSPRRIVCVDVDSPKAIPNVPYGLWRSQQHTACLIIGEGESDAWAAWLHGVAYLGLPGANTADKLELEHVAAYRTVYAFDERDDAGSQFAQAVVDRLAAVGFSGDVRVIDLAHVDAGHWKCKDLSDLHVLSPMRFMARLAEAFRTSRPGTVSAPQPTPQPPLNHNPATTRRPVGVNGARRPPHESLDKEAVRLFVDGVDLPTVITQDVGSPSRGERWCCPFHDDTPDKPDLAVYVDNQGRQRFKCHSCGVHGDVIEFVQARRGTNFLETLEFLGFSAKTPLDSGVRRGINSSTVYSYQERIDSQGINPPTDTRRKRGKAEKSDPEQENSSIELGDRLDAHHLTPITQDLFSQCRGSKIPLKSISDPRHNAIKMFPCRRRCGCAFCSPVWKEERSQWYRGILQQWGDSVYVWRADEPQGEFNAKKLVDQVKAGRKRGENIYYIRVPTNDGDVVFLNRLPTQPPKRTSKFQHWTTTPVSQERASTWLAQAIYHVTTEGREQITSPRAIRFPSRRTRSQAWEINLKLRDEYDYRLSPKALLKQIKSNPCYINATLTECAECSSLDFLDACTHPEYHNNPAMYEHREDGKTYCPDCGKFMGMACCEF